MNELLCHLVGDYVLQSHWMATEKTRSTVPAVVHGVFYTLPFVLLTQSILSLLIISFSHALIDRFRVARYVCWFKNHAAPRSEWEPWRECRSTGYNEIIPSWLSTWLMIIVDNILHLIINHLVLMG